MKIKSRMKLGLSFTLSLLTSLAGAGAQAHDVAYAKIGNIVSTETTKSECVKIVHEVCEQIFGQCAKSNEAALGGSAGYLVMYQCSYVKMDVNGVVSLVIAGSRTENTDKSTLNNWVNKSLDLAHSRFR